MFGILKELSVSQWAIVYDGAAERIHFKTLRVQTPRHFSTRFPYDCRTPVLAFDMERAVSGDIGDQFRPYTIEANTAMVRKALSGIVGSLPSNAEAVVVRHPETTRCMDP